MHNAIKIHDRAKADIQRDFELILERLREEEGTDAGAFMQKILEWKNDNPQLLWEVFHEALELEDRNFFGSLDSFVGNCLFDDSAFTVEWRKPDYILKEFEFDGRVTHFNEVQWLPSGDIKMILTTKDDPKGSPVVLWARDDSGRKDPKLLIEAMDIAEQRAAQRLKDLEEALTV